VRRRLGHGLRHLALLERLRLDGEAPGPVQARGRPADRQCGRAGEPDLVSCAPLNSVTVPLPAFGTHTSPARSTPTSPGLWRAGEEITTLGAGEPDLVISASVNSSTVLAP
jgi:hypothetical protein